MHERIVTRIGRNRKGQSTTLTTTIGSLNAEIAPKNHQHKNAIEKRLHRDVRRARESERMKNNESHDLGRKKDECPADRQLLQIESGYDQHKKRY